MPAAGDPDHRRFTSAWFSDGMRFPRLRRRFSERKRLRKLRARVARRFGHTT